MKNLLILALFIGLCFLHFGLAMDNGFWHSYDFVSLELSLTMSSDLSAAFISTPPFKFQPLVYSVYYLLFKAFEFNARGYFIFNILLHGFNSFLVYLLVNTLLKDRGVALLSGFLFAFTVGSYGKSVMIMSGLDGLIITTLTLLTMFFYFKNELAGRSRILSPWFFLSLLFFIASMLTSSTSFSILGAFIAFNFFFRMETGRRIFGASLLVMLGFAMTALIIKTLVFHYTPHFYTQYPGPLWFFFYTGKNIINYLVRMIFPIHTSHLVTEAGPAVRFIYRFATEIRLFIALTVVSYSIFGFIFGNRSIRFFIAWTYIMVFPFSFFQFPSDWLNIRHLYLVSVGFVVIISAGALYCSRLISRHRWRRYVPVLVPVLFILMSRFIVTQLDRSYEDNVLSELAAERRKVLVKQFPQISIEGTELRLNKEMRGSSGAERSEPD